MAELHDVQPGPEAEESSSLTTMINACGAVLSLALVIGIGVWGYKLLVRDVSGVPVVRAAEGPMRIQPEDPGGQQAEHQGLAVNDVAAVGSASQPADRLILAPAPLELTLDDTEMGGVVLAQLPQGETRQELEENAAAVANEDQSRLAAVQALADEIANGVSPLEELSEEPAAEAESEAEAEDEIIAVAVEAPKVEGGLGRSLRPRLRPASLQAAPEVVDVTDAAAPQDIDPETIPAGSRLAQLGAFESPEIAIKEWTRLSDEFAEYLEGKDRVIQKAISGGRTFYRLRAMGFADLNDARRFCSALVAEKAECIPVVTR